MDYGRGTLERWIKEKSGILLFDSLKEGFWYVWSHDGFKYLEIKYKDNQLIHFTNCVVDSCD